MNNNKAMTYNKIVKIYNESFNGAWRGSRVGIRSYNKIGEVYSVPFNCKVKDNVGKAVEGGVYKRYRNRRGKTIK